MKVVVEVLDHAPPDLTPAERLVLVVLAERCRDDTRRVLPGPDEPVRTMLLRRCGLGTSGLTKVLRRLSKRGLDVRVPLAVDGAGRPVYAWEGRSAEFAVPVLAKGGREGTHSVIHSVDERPPSCVAEGGREGTHGDPLVHPLEPERVDERAPLSLSPSDIPQPRATLPADHAEAVAELLARHGPALSEDLALACVEVVARVKNPDSLKGYVSAFDLAGVLRWAAKSDGPTALAQEARCPEPGHRGRRGLDADGDPWCQDCATTPRADREAS